MRASPAAVQPRDASPAGVMSGAATRPRAKPVERPRQLHLAHDAAWRVALAAMPEHVHQITAALPCRGASGRHRRKAVVQEQQVPAQHPEADVEREIQLGPAVCHVHRTQLHHISVDRIRIRPRHAAIGRVGHCRIELLPVAPDPVVQRPPEILCAPAADAIVGIGRDVGRVDRAEAALHRQAAGKWRAARSGMAGGAVRRLGRDIFRARRRPAARSPPGAGPPVLPVSRFLVATQPRQCRDGDGRGGDATTADAADQSCARPASAQASPGSHRAPPGSSAHSRCSGRCGSPAPRRPSPRPRRAAPARA